MQLIQKKYLDSLDLKILNKHNKKLIKNYIEIIKFFK